MNPLGHAAKSHVNGLWDESRIAMLTKLYEDGLTHGQIADKFAEHSAHFRPSRSAVVGKVHRLIEAGMLKHRGANVEAARRSRIRAARNLLRDTRNLLRDTRAARKPPNNHDAKVRPPKAPPPKPEAVPATARPWLTRLDHECRAPIGEPGADMLMCCAPAGHGTGGDYCEGHAARLFRKTERQQDEQRAKRA